jgi:hypothetical protein
MKRTQIRKNMDRKRSKRNTLPLLRGMFVSQGLFNKQHTEAGNNFSPCCMSEDGLFITAREGQFLGL